MNTADSQRELSAIEIALDLAQAQFSGSPFDFSSAAEPRVCLVAALALTSQLQHIVAAVDRAIPARLPAGLRVFQSTPRPANRTACRTVCIQPMLALIRFQTKLIRAIEPGLAHDLTPATVGNLAGIDDATAHFAYGFISSNALPAFEPASICAEFEATPLKAIGVSIYRLGRGGIPQSTICRWPFAESVRTSLHLRSGP